MEFYESFGFCFYFGNTLAVTVSVFNSGFGHWPSYFWNTLAVTISISIFNSGFGHTTNSQFIGPINLDPSRYPQIVRASSPLSFSLSFSFFLSIDSDENGDLKFRTLVLLF